MPTLIFGLLVLVGALWVLGVISRIDPKIAARVIKAAGGILAIGFAAFLGLRGEVGIAIPLGIFGLGLLGWIPFGIPGFSQRTQKSTGQTSRVRSAFLEMELDHDSGAMRGRVVAGSRSGAALEQLDVQTLAGLLAEFDDESRALLVAYLDRRQPGWSENAQGYAAAGRAHAGSPKMTEQEAYQILGVEPGASAEAITRAHRTLMKKLHPDQGGSTYLAARINEAKEILSRRHR
ncbi:MAG TPA: DnaJ domain-containing protein [Pseudolabrys sp.]|nr:DnaJ domain-containing protein [Pseudolabrys sp.]